MASSVEILLQATDKASSTIGKVNTSLQTLGKTGTTASQGLAKAGTATSSMGTSLLSMGKSMLGPIAALGSLGAAVRGAVGFVKSSISSWAEYNEQMRKLSAATGTGVEDLSRLMQAADDMGVSMDAMRTAMIYAAKNGIQPTIENIAKLSDRLNAIQDPTQRAAEMTKIFGRGFGEVAGFVLQGSDAINKATAAIDDNLVSTDASVQASREYAVAMDELAESQEKLGNMIAKTVTPNVTAATIEFNKLATAALDLDAKTRLSSLSFDQWIQYLFHGATLTELLGEKLVVTSDKYDSLRERVLLTTEAEEELNVSIVDQTAAALLDVEALKKYNTIIWSAANKTTAARGAFEQLEKAFIAAGYSAEEAAAMVRMLADQVGRIQSKTVVIDLIVNASGDLEYLDPLSERGSDILALAKKGASAGGGSGGGSGSNVNTQKGSVEPPKSNEKAWMQWKKAQGKEALGGISVGGQVYLVGERGPELFMPTSTGKVIPNNQTTNNYNLTINSNAKTESLLMDFALLQVMNG